MASEDSVGAAEKREIGRHWAESMRNFSYMALNVFCVVSIVIMNKKLYSEPINFRFGNTLVCVHFVVTAVLCVVAERAGVFDGKTVPFGDLMKLAATQVGSVAFVNFSLLYNSVGLYQVLKLLNIPVICVMEFFWLAITYTADLKLSLFVILLGVGLATVTEVEFSLPGFIHGALATVATGAYQILCGEKQKQHNINAMQLLHAQAPYTALMLGALALMFDDTKALVQYPFDTWSVSLIMATGLIAFGVNLTVFLIIGKTSPVTYQVVGHFKTCAVIFFGFTILHQPFVWKNLFGIVLAVVGMMWYTYIKHQQSQARLALNIELARERERERDRERDREAALEASASETITPHKP
eukprot:RCo013319